MLQVKWLKKIFILLYADQNILHFNEDSGDVVFNWNEMNNINLDNNFDEGDPDTNILARLLAWHIKFEKHKELKKS